MTSYLIIATILNIETMSDIVQEAKIRGKESGGKVGRGKAAFLVVFFFSFFSSLHVVSFLVFYSSPITFHIRTTFFSAFLFSFFTLFLIIFFLILSSSLKHVSSMLSTISSKSVSRREGGEG